MSGPAMPMRQRQDAHGGHRRAVQRAPKAANAAREAVARAHQLRARSTIVWARCEADRRIRAVQRRRRPAA